MQRLSALALCVGLLAVGCSKPGTTVVTSDGSKVTSDGATTTIETTNEKGEKVKAEMTSKEGDMTIKDANGNTILTLNPVASAVNSVQISNDAAGGTPQIKAQGSDTNVGLMLMPKGTGALQVYADTGATPRMLATGPDTNINLNLQTKGSGVVQANGVEVVTLTGTQALTLKTLTSPKITPGNAPASASAAGAAGQVEWDSGYVYVCTAANTWKRAAVATW